jgi:hypothetical protein
MQHLLEFVGWQNTIDNLITVQLIRRDYLIFLNGYQKAIIVIMYFIYCSFT